MMKSLALIAFVCALVAAGAASAQPSGQDQFLANCSACHQPTGKGIAGAFPALAGDPFVQGDPAKVLTTVLNGRGGMPTFKAELSNEQIAAILTYVRSAWGNHGGPVTPAMVAAARGGDDLGPARGLQAH
jgi:mono/diheme cytochrome c family protein